MLAKATGTSAVTVKGKIYCGFIDNQDSFNCKGDDGGAYRLKNSYYYEPVTLKPGDRVRIKEGAIGSTIDGLYVLSPFYAQDGYPDIVEVLNDMVIIHWNNAEYNITIHESAISEIIEQNPNRTITISEETYQLIKDQLKDDQ